MEAKSVYDLQVQLAAMFESLSKKLTNIIKLGTVKVMIIIKKC